MKQSSQSYIEAIGRRKTATARVRISAGTGQIVVNDRPMKEYFPLARLQKKVNAPIDELHLEKKYAVSAQIVGGGINAQADALRLGLTRALIISDASYAKQMRVLGFVTRDARKVERKKYGLKKARRAPQWAKR